MSAAVECIDCGTTSATVYLVEWVTINGRRKSWSVCARCWVEEQRRNAK